MFIELRMPKYVVWLYVPKMKTLQSYGSSGRPMIRPSRKKICAITKLRYYYDTICYELIQTSFSFTADYPIFMILSVIRPFIHRALLASQFCAISELRKWMRTLGAIDILLKMTPQGKVLIHAICKTLKVSPRFRPQSITQSVWNPSSQARDKPSEKSHWSSLLKGWSEVSITHVFLLSVSIEFSWVI